MIIPYKEVSHNIYLFHEHITYIFKKMFDHDLPYYDENLLVHPDFIPIIKASKAYLLNPIKELVHIYHNLPYGDKIQLQIAMSYNNSIDALSNKEIQLVKYEHLNPLISKKLQTFCVNLWLKYPHAIQMETDFGTVKDHYDDLIDEENFPALICPFCGIGTFEPAEGKYREAYDHLIAKASYPFASVNFKLLFPACYKCNSNEKRTTDTVLNDDGTRRSIYYPYDSELKLDDLKIRIVPQQPYDKEKLETLLRSINWHFEFSRNGSTDERLDSWDNVYHIKRRYFERLYRLEKEWFYQLQSEFKISLANRITFAVFQKNFTRSAKYQILISGMGIIKFSYFNFLFSIPNFEDKLRQSIY